MYREQYAHLVKRVIFKCMRGINRTSLVAQGSKAQKEIAVPRPGIACLSLVRRITIKCIKNLDKHDSHHGKITSIRLQDSRKQVRYQLASLEKVEGVSADIAIITRMFQNQAGTKECADIVGEQVATSLSEL